MVMVMVMVIVKMAIQDALGRDNCRLRNQSLAIVTKPLKGFSKTQI